MTMRRAWMAGIVATGVVAATPSQARITRFEIVKTEPAFGGASFGTVGGFERITARAHGEVDPKAAANAVIQDIGFAPRNARGMVEYTSDVEIVRPSNPARANGVLLFNVVNRGNKGALSLFNADVPGPVAAINALANAGDGWLQKQGYTTVWYAWQGDVLPGDNRMALQVPVARNPDGSPITGRVRTEIIVTTPADSANLDGGWFTGNITDSYPTASTDNLAVPRGGVAPALTMRAREGAAATPIAVADWHFGSCADPADARRICLAGGFRPGVIYELTYTAKDPTVLGLGYAAGRDLGVFLKTRDRDDAGTANPVAHGRDTRAILMGSSQSGRYIHSLIHLGFNKGEAGGQVFEGALPHIGGGLMPLNVRFGQPGRAWGSAVDRDYPGYDFPFSYARQSDPLTGRTQGLLDRCTADRTCPRIVHAATALEVWDGRQSLGFTDPLGMRDVAEPANVRSYIMASTQHGPAALPLPTTAPFGVCAQQPNPNPHVWTMRALLTALTAWVVDDKRPPASTLPRIADATLVPADQVRFPVVPAVGYGGVQRPALHFIGSTNPLHVYDRGPQYRAGDTSGIETVVPPKVGSAAYGVLVPQVDADGNDIAGIRSLFVQVPIGTYTGWNSYRADWFDGAPCTLVGSFSPFAAARAEREAVGDSRRSLAERYPDKAAYVNAVRMAADRLVASRFLLPDDANRLIAEAEQKGVRTAP